MSDEIEGGTIPPRNVAQVATAENSTTLAVQLQARKRWAVAASVASMLSGLGFTFAALVPVLQVPGLVVGALGAIGAVGFGAAAGAEIDTKAIEAIAVKVAAVLERPKP